MRSFPVRRNTLVLSMVLFLLAVFGWAGWANWEYRRLANEKRIAMAAAEVQLTQAADRPLVYRSPLVGRAAPNFTLPDLNGKKVSLASYKGKTVLINFWATWCAPCKEETPWLVELRQKYASQGFEVLGVSSEGDDAKPGTEAWNKDKAAIAAFASRQKIPYPVLLGGDGVAMPYGGIEDLPASFYVNRKGVIVMAQVGIDSKATIEANIKKALRE